MIINHQRVGDVSKTMVDFGDRAPSEDELQMVRVMLGLNQQNEREDAEQE